MRASASARSDLATGLRVNQKRHLARRPRPGNVLGSTQRSARGPPAQLRRWPFERYARINGLLVA
eukprot:2756491-Alexandrium_andersonii.AAC.1